MTISLGQVIATRHLATAASPQIKVDILIGMPSQFPDSIDYFVPYQIKRSGTDAVKYAAGIDAVQALQLAMKMIGYEIQALNESLGGALRWEGDETGLLGFE